MADQTRGPQGSSPDPQGSSQPAPDQLHEFEASPLQRGEYITAMAHLYRGELQRSLSWRLRLDTTTNWAIFTTAGILTFSFNNPQYAAQTLLAGMYAPRNYGADYAEAFDAIYPELAEAYDVHLYPFFLEGVATDPDLNQADGIHPNAAGVEVIVENITPYVVEVIEDAGLAAGSSG